MPGFVLPKLTVPEARRWLPAVVLILCLSMFGMVGFCHRKPWSQVRLGAGEPSGCVTH